MPRDYFDRDAWTGRLKGYERPTPTMTLRAPLRRARSSGAGAFLGLGSDGNQYWFKVPGNPQGDRVLVNEVIVEEVGRLIGAPVCRRALALVPPSSSRWTDFPVRPSEHPLVAHASLHVPGAVDDDALAYTRRDDNARRQASLLALWDLCVGDDEQWLYDASNSSSIWSYDHGLWFTTGEGDWDTSVLERLADLDGAFRNPPAGLSKEALLQVADRLESLTPDSYVRAMSAVPLEWGASDHDLESMAWFLYYRAPAVAARTRRIAA
ncbi:hypothetical protein RS84_00075 [Microbacterium hydrocarbonoxydans]|jgi:hypothetical protein|uniref:Uncharacterized protein n=1 Tax=Microbacterium hydrocarbonoxydans TaxID=273678 RepID=A0A0M2HRJ6_9MICO|nr:hypothetical protein [Microbacterium hydrocarbonoxydans]KJL49367.1 hypothetical protein RS84_00075 [Microbacterium hydrocarbonoxydans]